MSWGRLTSVHHDEESQTIALLAIGYIVANEDLKGRFLDLSGLDPASLRAGLDTAGVQQAALHFLTSHEPDLVACAEVIGHSPARIAMAARDLDTSPEGYAF